MICRVTGRHIAPEFLTTSARVRLPTGPGLHFTNTRAKEKLGWRPDMPLEDGIRRLLKDHIRRKGLDPAILPD